MWPQLDEQGRQNRGLRIVSVILAVLQLCLWLRLSLPLLLLLLVRLVRLGMTLVLCWC